MAAEALLMFVRFPEPGKVKSRLIPRLGPAGAAEVYRRMACQVSQTILQLERPGLLRVALVEPGERVGEVRNWLGEGFEYIPQVPGDLGERLRAGFDWAFQRGIGRVVTVGTDCLDLGADLLREGLDALAEKDAVLGPALDGGYYLIGLSTPIPSVFEEIPWSTDRVRETTLERLEEAGASSALLPVLQDLDTPEDLDALLPRWGDLLGI